MFIESGDYGDLSVSGDIWTRRDNVTAIKGVTSTISVVFKKLQHHSREITANYKHNF